jgi:hypothetical protein
MLYFNWRWHLSGGNSDQLNLDSTAQKSDAFNNLNTMAKMLKIKWLEEGFPVDVVEASLESAFLQNLDERVDLKTPAPLDLLFNLGATIKD